MTCENCIHKELCYENCELNYDKDDLTCYYCKSITCPEHLECKFFKDKSRFVELPCNVGNYVIWDNGVCLIIKPVRGFCLCSDGLGWRIDLGDCSPIVNHNAIKGFYANKQEAENALKEMKRNES